VFGYTIFAALVFGGMQHALALLLATCIGVLFNYFSTGRIVFGNRGAGRLTRFILCYALVYLCNLGLMELGVALGANIYAAGAISTAVATVVAFVLNRQFVFPDKP
jgi:putative flippase GtrA